MRRFLIFAVLGPQLPYLPFLLVMMALGGSLNPGIWGMGIFLSYLIGFVPALIAWGANILTARRPGLWRLAITSVAGMAGTVAWLAVSTARPLSLGFFVTFGALGCVVAPICSALADRVERKRGVSAAAAAESK